MANGAHLSTLSIKFQISYHSFQFAMLIIHNVFLRPN